MGVPGGTCGSSLQCECWQLVLCMFSAIGAPCEIREVVSYNVENGAICILLNLFL
jgi:hypothetical protein